MKWMIEWKWKGKKRKKKGSLSKNEIDIMLVRNDEGADKIEWIWNNERIQNNNVKWKKHVKNWSGVE